MGTSEPATIMICVQEDEAPDATSITDVTIEEVDATEEVIITANSSAVQSQKAVAAYF